MPSEIDAGWIVPLCGLTLFVCALAPLWQRISQAVALFIVVDLVSQVIQGDAERAGAVYVSEKVWGDHARVYRYLRSEGEGARLLAAVLSGKAVGMLRCKKFHWNEINAFSIVLNQEAGGYRGCGVFILGDAQNLITGHPACSGWPTSQQGAGPCDLQRWLPASVLPWKKILQFEMEKIQNKPNFAIC